MNALSRELWSRVAAAAVALCLAFALALASASGAWHAETVLAQPMPRMPAKNEQLVGAFASTLDFEQKLCLLLTPNRYQEFCEERSIVQYWLRLGHIDEHAYRIIVWEDPNKSLWAKYTRLGTAAWGRQVIEMSDVTALIAPASQVLGLEEETNDPVMKKERNFEAETLSDMLQRDDLQKREVIRDVEAGKEHLRAQVKKEHAALSYGVGKKLQKLGKAGLQDAAHAAFSEGISEDDVDGDVSRATGGPFRIKPRAQGQKQASTQAKRTRLPDL